MFNQFKNTLLEILYPQTCVGCQAPETSLCASCITLVLQHELTCFACGTRNQTGIFCATCKKNFPFITRIITGSAYHNHIIKESITRFKYTSEHALAHPLSTIMVPPFKKALQGITPRMRMSLRILAIPLHAKRKRFRGYNQAHILAEKISHAFAIPLLPETTLQRIRNTPPQVGLLQEARKENIKNAFVISSPALVQQCIIILVDDVVTTGTTLKEAARILKANGAHEIWGLTIAKG